MGSRYAPGSELILKEGVTTSDGNILGTTLIDASLIGKPNYPTALQVRLLSGTYQLITRTVQSFDNTTGTITLPSSTPFPGQIVTGTGYVIMGVSATSADVLDALEILSPVNSTTTNAGNVGGTTIIDTARTEGLDYWKSQTLMITSGACDGQVREITAFDNATQTFTVSPAFAAQIAAGVTYRVLSQLPADIDITALQADMGDASASTLGSIYGILGNPTQSFDTNLNVSATEELKNFIAKTGGTEIGLAKSHVDALGHTGLARLDSGLDGVLADGLINGAGTVLPADTSLYDELGGATFNTATDSLEVIAADVAQILDMTQTESLVAVTNVETDLFLDNPAVTTNGLVLKVDLTNMIAGDTYVIREKYQITAAGTYFQVSDDASNTYVGVQAEPLKAIHLDAYRHGCEITAQRLAGGDRSFQVEVIIEG